MDLAPRLARVAHDDPRLDRLLQLYVHEWTALVPSAIGADARYAYPDLPAWADPVAHRAYLAMVDDRPHGFALIARADGAWHVEEFFVVDGVRRSGLGRAAAVALFDAHPGAWTWTIRPENPGAAAFWRQVAPTAIATPEPGEDGIVRTRLRLTWPPA